MALVASQIYQSPFASLQGSPLRKPNLCLLVSSIRHLLLPTPQSFVCFYFFWSYQPISTLQLGNDFSFFFPSSRGEGVFFFKQGNGSSCFHLLSSERQKYALFSRQGLRYVSLHLPLVFAKKSSPVFILPQLRKFGKKQVVFFLQKTLPSLPTLHFDCLSLVNSGFLPLVKISGSYYVYILNSML